MRRIVPLLIVLAALPDRLHVARGILACGQAGIAVTAPRPSISGAEARGRFGKRGFVDEPAADAERCPAGGPLAFAGRILIETRSR